MELNVPTIAQRKAAKRSQSHEVMESTNVPLQSADAIIAVEKQRLQINPETNTNSPKSDPMLASTLSSMNREKLIEIAKSMGLEVVTPKKLWIKHSYSVTPESKEKFSKYCETLGIKMQDGLEEAFQDWFKKKELEFTAIINAKQP
jgi:hypothetical protein